MNQLATHAHALQGTTDSAGDGSPIGRVPATTAGANIYNSDAAPTLAPMDSEVVGGMGGNQPVNNLMPFVCISFIIALFGVYPSRN